MLQDSELFFSSEIKDSVSIKVMMMMMTIVVVVMTLLSNINNASSIIIKVIKSIFPKNQNHKK